MSYNELRPDLVAEVFGPEAVFDGPVTILDDYSAVSAGDVFPTEFVGDAFDGNLGGNTQVHVVGSIYGMFRGFSAFGDYIPINGQSPEFFVIDDDDGDSGDFKIEVSPYQFYVDTARTMYSVPPNVTDFRGSLTTRRLPGDGEYKWGLVPVCSNLDNSPLYSGSSFPGKAVLGGNGDMAFCPLAYTFEDGPYHDFGYRGDGADSDGNTFANGHWDSNANGGPTGLTRILRFGGANDTLFPDQPDDTTAYTKTMGPSMQEKLSFRDSHLEEAIRVTCQQLLGVFCPVDPVPASVSVASTAQQDRQAVRLADKERDQFKLQELEKTRKITLPDGEEEVERDYLDPEDE